MINTTGENENFFASRNVKMYSKLSASIDKIMSRTKLSIPELRKKLKIQVNEKSPRIVLRSDDNLTEISKM